MKFLLLKLSKQSIKLLVLNKRLNRSKMKILTIFWCLVSAVLSTPLESFNIDDLVPIYETEEWQEAHPGYAGSLKTSPQRNARIWRGVQALEGDVPYHVEVAILLSRTAWCGGSIVSSNFVLSAAQCFPRDPPARVSGGRIDRENPLFSILTSSVTIHPAFNVSLSFCF